MARQSTLARFEISGEILGEDVVGQLTAQECRLPGAQRAEKDLTTAWGLLSDEWQLHRQHLAEYGTERLRRRWIMPFLETFDFSLEYQKAHLQFGDNQTIPITYRTDGGVPIWVLDYGQSPDDKIVTGRRNRSPHEVFQDYLDYSGEDNWGIICNGRTIRLLHDYHKTLTRNYVEADLESIFESLDVDAFRAVWRIFHADGFRPDNKGARAIELLRDYSRQEGAEVGRELRFQVLEALKILGNGFLAADSSGSLLTALRADTANAPMEFYQALLRIVYRLLFLFYIENKPGWTPASNPIWASSYSITRLREQAEEETSSRTNGEDHWEGLRVVFGMIRHGYIPKDGRPFVIHPYGGELFNDEHLWQLADKPLRNADLLAAIRRLTTFERNKQPYRVNFRTLRIEALGSVYEALLDVAPVITDDGVFDFGEGTDRKLSGSYYTPPSLVGELIKSALVPVMEDRLKDAETKEDAERALLSIRVVDPACGSGHFLLAATDTLAARLCHIRLGGEEPSDLDVREARRDVVQNCIFGVDVRPMAVELCKFGLWLHVAHPTFPLSYLEPHILWGNALVGVPLLRQVEAAQARVDAERQRLLDAGEVRKAANVRYIGWPTAIPGDAYEAVAGDDKAAARRARSDNENFASTGQLTLGVESEALTTLRERVSKSHSLVMAAGERTDADIRRKDVLWKEHRAGKDYNEPKLLADLWCAAFYWQLDADADATVPTTEYLRRIGRDGVGKEQLPQTVAAELARVVEVVRPFHWELEFPEIFEAGGFDCVLGNPPWERIKLQEQEFFASRAPDIARAANKAARQRMIDALETENPALHAAFQAAKHAAESESKFIRKAGRFPLTAIGDVNTYALFAEHFRTLLSPMGRAGVIVPTGIATDDTTKHFFGDLVVTRALESYFGFKNERFLFQRPVEHTVTFGLLTMLGVAKRSVRMEFCWLAYSVEEMQDQQRRIVLTAEDIALVNPNTLTCPVFRTSKDRDISQYLYLRVPAFQNETVIEISWKPYYIRLVHLADHKDYVRFSWENRPEQWDVCTYESKLIQAYDHRYGTFDDVSRDDAIKGKARLLRDDEKVDRSLSCKPRYYVPRTFASELHAKYPMWRQPWLLLWRDVARSTDERTAIATAVPKYVATVTSPGIGVQDGKPWLLLANLNALVLDYCARQKVGGIHLNWGILQQLPILPPSAYSDTAIAFIASRVLELSYTAYDMRPFAEEMGYEGEPFVWGEERRALLRAELDAYYARLYGLTRKQLRYILDPHGLSDAELADILDPTEDPTCAGPHLLPAEPTTTFPGETFRVLKYNETVKYGEYRTRRLVLDAWARLEAELGPAPVRNYRELVATSQQPTAAVPPAPSSQRTAARATVSAAGSKGKGAREARAPRPGADDFMLRRPDETPQQTLAFDAPPASVPTVTPPTPKAVPTTLPPIGSRVFVNGGRGVLQDAVAESDRTRIRVLFDEEAQPRSFLVPPARVELDQ